MAAWRKAVSGAAAKRCSRLASRSDMMRPVGVLIIGIGLAAATPLSAAGEQSVTPRRGGTLTFAVDAEPPNFDCHENVSFALIHPVAPHYSTLLKFDGPNYPEIKGDLADSWTVSADKLTYSFKLHPGILFHDGSKLTSADVKASYERIVAPPPGVRSPRQATYAAIHAIDTPDPLTVVFRLEWPEASMLANFASPWNCIYSAAKITADPKYPETHILGTGPFTFVEYVKGSHWTGRRWEKYFRPGEPYLDGYEARFMKEAASTAAMSRGEVAAQFRSVTPDERDDLVRALGDKATVGESPWLINLLIVFNTKKKPFDDARVRRALSLAIDRWKASEVLSPSTFVKFVGGLLRPGFAMATPEGELAALPGFSRDIETSRRQARDLLKEAGLSNLEITLVNRDVPVPYGPSADFIIDSWRQIGVAARQVKLNTKEWETSLERGEFEVGIDFAGDYFDDPTLQLAKYVSAAFSPSNHARPTDKFLDALYVGQALTADPTKRVAIVRDFERHALTEAYSVPFLWWNRIVVTSSRLKGWTLTPSHYINQDLAEVWLER